MASRIDITRLSTGYLSKLEEACGVDRDEHNEVVDDNQITVAHGELSRMTPRSALERYLHYQGLIGYTDLIIDLMHDLAASAGVTLQEGFPRDVR